MKNAMAGIILAAVIVLSSCGGFNQESKAFKNEVDSFLVHYNAEFQKYLVASNEGQWKLNTYIVEGDTATSNAATRADEAFAKFTGDDSLVKTAQKYLVRSKELSDLEQRQLKAIVFFAGANPQAAGALVKQKIEAQNKQIGLLYGYKFQLKGKDVTPNGIDEILQHSAVEKD